MATEPATPTNTSDVATTRDASPRNVRVASGWRVALREFVVIVAGVLCALAAQAWWEHRQERRREAEYLQQLLSDTRANEAGLRSAVEYDSVVADHLQLLNQALYADGSQVSGDSVLALFNSRAFSSSDLRLLSGTYRALVTAGDLRLIRNDSVRAGLIEYAAMLEQEEAMLLFFLQQYAGDPTSFGRPLSFMRGLIFGSTEKPRIDVAAMRRNPDVDAVMIAVKVANLNRLAHLRRMLAQTHRLRCMLEAEHDIETADCRSTTTAS